MERADIHHAETRAQRCARNLSRIVSLADVGLR